MGQLRRKLRIREIKIIKTLVMKTRVIVATLRGSSFKELCSIYNTEQNFFNTVTIDEMAQSMEPQCWIPLISHYKSNYNKLLLADDNKIKLKLEITIFDRLEKTIYRSI